MKQLLAPLACCVAFASIATAQLSDYLGPGVMTDGAGQIGNRSGEQVDLRYYVDANAVYDNGLQPISTNSEGKLTRVNGLYGVEALIGAYGTHSWKTALLGVDYRGDFIDYANGSYYDGSNQSLTIGYTYQKSRRLFFDLRGSAALIRTISERFPVSKPVRRRGSIRPGFCCLTTAPTFFRDSQA